MGFLRILRILHFNSAYSDLTDLSFNMSTWCCIANPSGYDILMYKRGASHHHRIEIQEPCGTRDKLYDGAQAPRIERQVSMDA